MGNLESYMKTTWLKENNKQENFLIKEIIEATPASLAMFDQKNYYFESTVMVFDLVFKGFYLYPNTCVNIKDLEYDSENTRLKHY